MKEHFQQMDADIIGLSEVDAATGDCSDSFTKLTEMMRELNYEYATKDKPNGMSASTIFWKKDKFNML